MPGIDVDSVPNDDFSVPQSFLDKLSSLTPLELSRFETLRLEWENWRISADSAWRERYRAKESKLRQQLEADALASLAERSEDLRRAHEEIAKLEAKLRINVDAVEQRKIRLEDTEEQVSLRLAQKTAELQLLQRRVRDESKRKMEAESQKAEMLEHQLADAREAHERLRQRAKEIDREFESCRQQLRGVPETQLREEVAKLRAELAEGSSLIEKEKALTSQAEIEREHFRAQMHRLATALKTERERSSVIARQELEQLRLEFLAREERYVLDGDRAALGDIRRELQELRSKSKQQVQSNSEVLDAVPPIKGRPIPSSSSSSSSSSSAGRPPEAGSSTTHALHGAAGSPAAPIAQAQLKLSQVNKQISSLLASGLYNDDSDPLVLELTKSLLGAVGLSPSVPAT